MVATMESRIREWNPDIRVPVGTSQYVMQAVVLGHFSILDAVDRLNGVDGIGKSPWLQSLIEALSSFDARTIRDMDVYARRYEAGQWVLSMGMPAWAAAGMVAGVMRGAKLRNASTLYTFCGMEARRYIPNDVVREIMDDVIGTDPVEFVEEDEIMELAERLDRSANLLPEKPTRNEVYTWATKRRHNEFLRTVALRIGEWIESHPENRYHKAYQEHLEREGDQALIYDSGATLHDLERFARTHATRKFLAEYFDHVDPEMKSDSMST